MNFKIIREPGQAVIFSPIMGYIFDLLFQVVTSVFCMNGRDMYGFRKTVGDEIAGYGHYLPKNSDQIDQKK